MKHYLLFIAVFCLALTGANAQQFSTGISLNNTAQKTAPVRVAPTGTTSSRGADECADATDISSLLGGEVNVTINSEIFDNTDATTSAADPTVGIECFADNADGPLLENTEWFTFTGDGNSYQIVTGDCGAADPMPGNDTQIALFSGDCDNLSPLQCNEDISGTLFNSRLQFTTEVGVTYYILVDGWNGTVGEYCLQVTRRTTATCDDISIGESVIIDPNNFLCLDELGALGITDTNTLVFPPNGAAGQRWLISTADLTGVDNPFADPSFLGAFGARGAGDNLNLLFRNNAGLQGFLGGPGTYYFTPVIYDNATVPADGSFAGLTFENGCIVSAASIEMVLSDVADPADLSVARMVEITEGDNNDTLGTITLTTTGGTDTYSYAWSTGDTTTVVDSLAEGTYTVTISDASPCVDDVVLTITVDFNPETFTIDNCDGAIDLTSLVGGPVGEVQTSDIFDNTEATTDDTEPTAGIECWGEATPTLHNTQWFSFVGDGNIYEIRTTGAGTTPNEDTQIAIYTGSCDNLVPAACNEDVSGQDFNTVISLITEADVTYYILVDGWDGTVGEYVVTFNQQEPFACADAVAPQGEAPSETLCVGDNLVLNITQGFELPAAPAGTLTEFRWVFAPQDISGSENPFADGFGGFIWFGPSGGTYNISTFVYNGGVGNPITPGVYFLTPIAYSGATATDPSSFATYNFDDACFVTGNSIEMTMLPELAALTVTPEFTPETPGASDGTASVTVTGGSGGREYAWDNGETTQTITGLAAGDYTVTVSDLTGCVEDVVVTVTVPVASSVNDPALGAAVQLFPNPASNFATFRYNFSTATDLTINVTNTLGQTVLSQRVANATAGTQNLDVSNLTSGTYFVRYTDGKRQAVKPLVILR